MSILSDLSSAYFPGGKNVSENDYITVGGSPKNWISAKNSQLVDSDHKTYIDVSNSSNILGYANPKISEAIHAELQNGLITSARLESKIAKILLENQPTDQKIKFFSSSSEACLNSIKIARSYTRKNKILKFSGNYHGDSDALIKDSGAGFSLTENLSSKGIPIVFSDLTLVSNYNDLEALEDVFRIHSEDLAAVIIEPVATNMGCIPAEFLFLKKLRELCDLHQTVLIFDESKTGFRSNFGGIFETYNMLPDLVVYGNTISNGFPIGVLIGNSAVMNQFFPQGEVFADPEVSILSLAATFSCLCVLKDSPEIYQNLLQKTEFLDFEIGKILNSKNIQHRINRKGSALSVFFHVAKVSDFQDAINSNTALYNNFFHHMLQNGIFLPPNALKSWFLPGSLQDNEIKDVLNAVKKFHYE